jgi:hypothetical protein
VRDVCSNDHEFGLAIVLGDLSLGLAHRELAVKGIARRPNLIEEIVVTEALENQGGSIGRLSLTALERVMPFSDASALSMRMAALLWDRDLTVYSPAE